VSPSPFKNLFSRLGRKEPEPPPAAPTGTSTKYGSGSGETTSFLTGDDRIDNRNVKLLLETMADLISDHDPAGLVRKIVDRAIRAVRAERCILLLKDADGGLRIAVAHDDKGRDLGEDFRYSKSLVQKALDQPECLIRSIGESDHPSDLSASVVDLKLRAVMCVRLSFKDEVLGVIFVDSRATERQFNSKDSRFFEALARAISIVLENARLLRAALEQERLKQSIEIARQVLASLLPKDPVDLDPFDLAGASIPAETAAGDYYDFIPCPDGRLGVVVGDVTGHGIGPAMVMTGARSALRTLFEEKELDEAAILARMNKRLHQDLGDGRFMSMLVGRLDRSRRVLTYANAGQTPPFLVHANGESKCLAGTGLALGIEKDVTYRVQPAVELERGDLLAIVTDGVIEARNAAGEFFGNDRLVELLKRQRDASARAVAEAIRAAVAGFTGTEQLEDDLTLVVLRVR
jgi:serine phosphatase RsbU (regulator of sigma subunit)